MKESARNSAILELTFAGALWGFGFIAAVFALRGMGPLSITGWRFAIALAVGLLIAFLIPKQRQDMRWDQFWLAAIPGFLISLTLVLQTWGLQYTTATKSGFITVLYALMVPLLERALLKRRLPRFHMLWVFLALFGIGLICDLGSAFKSMNSSDSALRAFEIWNFGDFLTLLCAVAASFHILYFGFIYKKIRSSFVFNNFQSFWAGLIPLTLSLFLEPTPQLSLDNGSWLGLMSLALGSSLLAFALQIHAQKHLSPSIASLLFLLESPFAAVFAVYFLKENLDTSQWVGAALILIAAVLTTIFSFEDKTQPELTELS